MGGCGTILGTNNSLANTDKALFGNLQRIVNEHIERRTKTSGFIIQPSHSCHLVRKYYQRDYLLHVVILKPIIKERCPVPPSAMIFPLNP